MLFLNITNHLKPVFLIAVCFFFQLAQAQPDTLFLKSKPQKYDGPLWVQKNKVSLQLSQTSFTNWNSGGANSISGLIGGEASANYTDAYFTWRNNTLVRYGVNKQEDRELRKTDDLIEFNSEIGFKPDTITNWSYSGKLNFRTQLANGFRYPNVDNPISRFMAPGYLFFGVGMENSIKKNKRLLYFSPLTLKATFVLDDDLANAGRFGVTPAKLNSAGDIIVPGERVRRELGVLINNSFETEIATNIVLKHQVSLYSDYINNFGNIDLDWRLDFNFKVNNYVKASFGSHIIYDDDVKTTKPSEITGETEDAGAKVQWRQFLGIGVAFDF